ncbi:sulfatase-like hydrolase/transferase [Paenibacillus pasadenensis]|uniref:sulfatase family protein n=1 Tax=Paenibacillus pasadenensis TaxID=217090 RepID=UPI00203B7994|nr:sulfatase [Paenibacillus pasadenensis]MCM3748794.1 sulfatase-like hydrolase/transferase [Paenibacillus pasadenensis]
MNFIFISLDTMRASRLGSYGYNKPTSPYIDKIASQGVLFEKAYAADIPTEVAHTGIFTGKIGLTTGVVSHGSELTSLSKSVKWLPSLLKNAGYNTAAVDNLYNLKEWFARGYRHYINSSGSTRWIDGRTVNELASNWLEANGRDPFFLFLHYWDPHTPYMPREEYLGEFYDRSKNPFDPSNTSMDAAYNSAAYPFFKYHHYDLLGSVTDADYMNALYDAEVRYLDDRIRELDEELERLGLVEDTMLVLFGDHGESLTEHDIYWDHCGLYDTTVNVPLIIRWPSRIDGGHRVPGLVQQVDLMPTLLEAAEIPVPDDLDGKSLWPSMLGLAEGTHEHVFLSECAWQAARGVTDGRYKLIVTYDSGPFKRPPRELYDLLTDPAETNNLAEQMPELADELQRLMDEKVREKLAGREDPMQKQLEIGLPFRRRIEAILGEFGLSWDDWWNDPVRAKFDEAVEQTRKKRIPEGQAQ